MSRRLPSVQRWLVGLVALCAGCGESADPSGEPQPDGPNVLLITLDTTRADRLGCYGFEAAKTPNIDGLARDGVRFARAYAPVPLTLPSHATLLSGVHASAHGVHVNLGGGVHPDVRTVAQEFQERGFRTGAFLAAWVLHEKFGLARGFDVYDDVEGVRGHGTQRSGDEVTDAALGWLSSLPEAPFFAWVHYFDPHDPYEPPPGFRQGFAHPYDGELAFVDSQVGRLLAWLDERGIRDDTLVVIVGDHGEGLEDHDEETHGVFLYDSTVHVPLVFCGPGVLGGHVARPVVGIIDVAPTLYAMLEWPVPEELEGQSLAAALAGAAFDPAPVFLESRYAAFFGWAPLSAVVTDRWKFVEAPRPELYRSGVETENLAEQKAEVVAGLRNVMEARRRQAVVRAASELTLSDGGNLAALGYVGGSPPTGAFEDLGGLADPKDHKADLRAVLQANERLVEGDHRAVVALLEPRMQAVGESLDVWTMYAGSLALIGRFEEALAAVRECERLGEPSPGTLCAKGDAELGLGRPADAERSYNRALELAPERGQTHSRLGRLHAQAGNTDLALEHLEQYVAAEPESANAHTNLANTLFRKQEFAQGIEHLQAALRHEPDCVPAHEALVTVYDGTGRPREALAALRAAERALPGGPFTSRLAWRLATAPDAPADQASDAREALRLALTGASANPESATHHDVLAAAHAHAGDFVQAVESAQLALALAEAGGNRELARAVEARLALYRSGKPYRRPEARR